VREINDKIDRICYRGKRDMNARSISTFPSASHTVVSRPQNCVYLWLYSPVWGLGRFFSFLVVYTVGRTPWKGNQPVGRPLPAHRVTQTQNKHTQTSIPRRGIRTQDRSVRAGEDGSCLRPRGHCARTLSALTLYCMQLHIIKIK
jgi:hypothetical protein